MYGHFATPLEYVISLISRLKIPLLLIKIKKSRQKNAEQVNQINRSGIFKRCNVVNVR